MPADPASAAPLAIVTGAASGMGHAVATRFLDEGWSVVALDLRKPDLGGFDGRLVRRAPVDVCDRGAVSDALRDLPADTGPVRAVLNVAGIYPPTTLADTSPERFRSIFETNVLGTLNVIAESVELIRSHGAGGSIVNFASVDAFAVSRGQLLYSAAKAAVVSITRSLAVELAADDITVNAVAPGWVDTPGNRAMVFVPELVEWMRNGGDAQYDPRPTESGPPRAHARRPPRKADRPPGMDRVRLPTSDTR